MTRTQAAELRRQFIEERQEILRKKVTSVENKLYDAILRKLIDELDKVDGKIVSNNKNVDLASTLDKIFREINASEYTGVIKAFAKDLRGVQNLNDTYFEIIAEDQEKIKAISRDVNRIMNKRIGLNSKGEVVKDGYLDKLIKDDALLKRVKESTYKAVTGGESIDKYRDRMKKFIVGNDKISGGLTKHFNTFAYDTYNQFDRTSQNLFANKLELQTAIYSGGTINTTREFCRKRNGKVFTRQEMEKWKSLVGKEEGPQWSEGDYNPFTDCGGHNCRHNLNWISNSEAIRRRPDLEGQI